MDTIKVENSIKNFGVNLAKIRRDKNISARQLSLQIGKDPSYICKAEKGTINISLRSFLKICATLQIKPSKLFSNEDLDIPQ
jgi:transcriptional regulator with XRE-family HTH domain